jgi:hypothetical protein
MSSSPGPFIYKGSGKKQAATADLCQKICKDAACLIQMCLAKNNHQQHKCQGIIDSWKQCCDKAKEKEALMAKES